HAAVLLGGPASRSPRHSDLFRSCLHSSSDNPRGTAARSRTRVFVTWAKTTVSAVMSGRRSWPVSARRLACDSSDGTRRLEPAKPAEMSQVSGGEVEVGDVVGDRLVESVEVAAERGVDLYRGADLPQPG